MAELGFIGAGNMGGALLRGVLRAGLVGPSEILVHDPNEALVAGLAAETGAERAGSNEEVVAGCRTVLLCVKPQVARRVLDDLASEGEGFGPETLLVSVAAGLSTASMEALVAPGTPVVRVMPNTPCLIGAGATGYARGRHAEAEHAERTRAVFEAVGVAYEVPEAHMDAVTALSGSGPAYVFYLMEALAAGAAEVGLDPAVARALLVHTVEGAARLAAAEDVDFAELRRRVTSPGGTTEAGVGQLEAGAAAEAFRRAVVAARDRGRELGRASG